LGGEEDWGQIKMTLNSRNRGPSEWTLWVYTRNKTGENGHS